MPRLFRSAADHQAGTPTRGTLVPANPAAPGDRVPPGDGHRQPPPDESTETAQPAHASQHVSEGQAASLEQAGVKAPLVGVDRGLYAVLGVDSAASNAEILTSYRRRAARLSGGSSKRNAALRQLNAAYEVLGHPVRRAEYDRMRQAQALSPGDLTPVRAGARTYAPAGRRRRPRHAVQPHYAGFGDVVVVLLVVGLAVLAGLLLVPRLSINLTPLNALQGVLPLSNNAARRPADAAPTPVPATPVPTPTIRPAVAGQFVGTLVSVSNPTPAQNTPERVSITLRRNNQPAVNYDVWASVQYHTTEERWPQTGTVKTDASGVATITFNIGAPLPNFEVQVHVFAQVDDEQLSWSTSFTPR